MPRRPAKVTQADVHRVARAAAQMDPPHVIRVLPDGSIVMCPPELAVVWTALPAAASPPAATEPAALA